MLCEKNKILFGLVVLFFLSFNPRLHAYSQLKCYFTGDFFSFNIGVGYFSGKGKVFCDDGRSVEAEYSGWNFLSVGVTGQTKNYQKDSQVIFSGANHIEELEGRYFGGGAQVTVPLIANEDRSHYSNGKVSLRWSAKTQGVVFGLPFKSVYLKFTGKVQEPSQEYLDTKKILSTRQIIVSRRQSRHGPNEFMLGFDFSAAELSKVSLLRFSVLIEHDGWLWNSDLRKRSIVFKKGDWPFTFYFLEDGINLIAGQTYFIYAGNTDVFPPIIYRYFITLPDDLSYLQSADIVPAQIEHIHEVWDMD